MRKAALLACLAATFGALFALPSVGAAQKSKRPKFDVLVFSKTAGFRHGSIPIGVERIRQLGAANRFSVTHTEDANTFRGNNLNRYEAVVFLSTTGDVLNNAQQATFERYIRDGGGYVGIHAAADTEYDWEFYGNLVGAYFRSHPAIQQATVEVADRRHPSTEHLPENWSRRDEWYDYRSNPRGNVHVLATLDESTYQGGRMGADHPIAWCQEFEGGRSWYTGGGHTNESYGEPAFQRHMLGGIQWAAGEEDGDCRASADSSFQKVTLNDEPGEPMGLAVLPDGRVLHTDRTGEVRIHDPETGLNTIAASLDVYQHDEEGVQSIALDPNFRQNRWVYLYYSPPSNSPVDDPLTPNVNEGDAPFEGTQADWNRFKGVVRLSRFKLQGNELQLNTEQRIIDVPTDQGICCHVGGHIDFDGQGNLYLSTGDDTNPFESDGYAPIDERPNRNPAFDAQRTSANTNDLRGKVLRIKPRRNSPGYDVPAGNLFPQGAPQTRPEIYLMGLRNPFRIAVNRENNDLYVADYSPDADEPDPNRGPDGKGKWFVARGPGNYGWPYCATAELPYQDYDFATEQSRGAFNCAAPVNESPHNTGLRVLPPVLQPDVWYGYGVSPQFPELGEGGIGPMAGPAYDYDRRLNSRVKWPEYYDGVPIFYEWTRDYLREFRLGEDGRVDQINPLLESFDFIHPMDLEFGADGALYTLEYGEGFFLESPDAQLARIDYVRGGRSPVPEVSATPVQGDPPLEVQFSSAGTHDPDGDRLRYEWDFDEDGRVDSREPNPTYTFEERGVHMSTLKVTDRSGRSASDAVQIIIGNDTPVVEFVRPVEGQPFNFGDVVQFEVSVTDDTPVDCNKVQVSYILGHDDHGHPITSAIGCSGSIQTSAEGHGGEGNLRGVFVATYEDEGIDGEEPLSDDDEVVLTPSG